MITEVSDEERLYREKLAVLCAETHVQTRGYKQTREMQILALAAVGHSDEEIAERLSIKVATIGTYWKRILQKHGSRTRIEAVATIFMLEVARLRKENKELAGALRDKKIRTAPRAASHSKASA